MERVRADNGVVYYRSELIPCIHGFSTRIGGVSKLPHTKSLNLGVDRGDSPDIVMENLKRFSNALGFECKKVISVPQIHSDKIRYVDSDNAGEGFFSSAKESCDGYVSDKSDIVLGVRTADCVPILLYAPTDGVCGGVVSAVHAGWRGTAAGIASRAVAHMIELGARAENIRAAIGPSIGACCYRVQSDFYNEFQRKAGVLLTEKYVIPIESGGFFADLKGANYSLLLESGLKPHNIDVCDMCTCCHTEEFFSHRATGGVRGTMLSVITLKE